jgi:hypothetical protein
MEPDESSPPSPGVEEPARAVTGEEVPSSPTAGIADGRERELDPRALLASRLTGLIATGVVAAGTGVAVLILLFAGLPALAQVLLVGGWALVVLQGLALAWFWTAARHRRTRYRLDAQGLHIRRGVWWQSEIAVPRSRVQHTDVTQGPLERVWGLSTLVVHTAGTENASIQLSGLAREDALAARDHLIAGGADDGV